jgi:hypothetical protein
MSAMTTAQSRDCYQRVCRAVTGSGCGIPAIHRGSERQPPSRSPASHRHRIAGSTPRSARLPANEIRELPRTHSSCVIHPKSVTSHPGFRALFVQYS